jgi:hypothetical protein
MDTKQEFKTTTELVKYILEHYPETRNSDNKLYIKCAQYKGAKTLSDLENIKLSIITVHKCRQKIQNRNGLFKATEDTQQIRKERAKEVKEFMVN